MCFKCFLHCRAVGLLSTCSTLARQGNQRHSHGSSLHSFISTVDTTKFDISCPHCLDAISITMSSEDCTLDTCSVSESFYGYRPNLGIDVFFTIVYIAVIGHCLFVVIHKRKWLGYTISVLLGALLEFVGFVLRVYGYAQPFVRIGWIIQYSVITFAPVFTSAA